MKIRYLKDAPQGRVGDVAVVQQYEADVLIRLGFAELVDGVDAPSQSPDAEPLKNLNGTPVVDDFGNVATISTETKEKPQPETRKNAKKGS